MPAIETLDLTKDYSAGFIRKRPLRALDGVNLRVNTGEVFGLLGPNGAGKSTTLKLLLRLIFPSAGTARVLGRELDDVAMHARLGYLPENPYFYDHLTAREFLNYAGELFRLPCAERRRRVDQLLVRLGLEASADLPLRKFSKGMVQRLGIAQALVNDPELIFLDEPMSGLDPLGRREVRDLILQLKAEGKTVFFSTHILSDAEVLCDRVAILNRGKLQGCGELREILSLGVSATEVVLENPPAGLLEEVRKLTRPAVKTGDRVRIEIPEEADVAPVLEAILRRGGKVVSVSPVKISLEDYFLEQVRMGPEKPPAEQGVARVDKEGER